MYIVWFLYGLYFLKSTWKFSKNEIDFLFFYIFLWVLLWWRIWYMLFYSFWWLLADPLTLLRIWEWWMSFHGGFLWVCVALYTYSQKYKKAFWSSADILAMIIPVWLFFGRIGNYINKELLGFEYNWPFAVVTSTGSFFPSPLVEAFLEWGVIFIVFHYILKKPSFSWQFAALFITLYGVFRTFVELFIRSPDEHIWYYFWFFTQWSFLSIPMILGGCCLYYFLSQKKYASI